MMQYDMIPSYNEDDNCFTMLVTGMDEETYEEVLFGACGDIVCWQEDLPSPREQEAMWMRYWRYVMETGNDQLDQIILPFKFKTRWTNELWQIAFHQAKSRLTITCRKGGRGKWVITENIPHHVRDYMMIDDTLFPSVAAINSEDARYTKDMIPLLEGDENTAYWTMGGPEGQHHAKAWALIWVPMIDNSVDTEALVDMATKFYNEHSEAWEKLRNAERIKVN